METVSVNAHRAIAIIATLAIIACAWYPPIQSLADEQVDAGLKRAMISFASARALNAVISVVQGTEISLQPMGVGVTLTLGQVLDPINDLVEEFSSLMLTAAVAFGVQKVLLAISANWVISLLVSAFAIGWTMLRFLGNAPAWFSRALLVLVMIRFIIPAITLGSDWAFQHLMASEYNEQQLALEVATKEMRDAAPKPAEGGSAEKGWWEKLKDRASSFGQNIYVKFDSVKSATENLPERIIKVIVIFVMQTIVIPIVLLWALYKVAFGVVRQTG